MDHVPVLLKEVLKYLNPKPGQNFIDCTFGFGGHGLALLEKIKPTGKILGIELDEEVLNKLKQDKERFLVCHGNFTDLEKIVKENNFYYINGILFDLGISSWQIEKSKRGFSFQRDEPLDMRLDVRNNDLSAEEIINLWKENELKKIFQEYGEERFSGRIARVICLIRQNKRIKTTNQLVEIIRQAIPGKYQYKRIHFATRVFQALRIAVNDELNNLDQALAQALKILEINGRLAVISFHSLEDRIVKNFFREQAKENNLKILTKKPISPTDQEISENPRSRSAKLRVAIKI